METSDRPSPRPGRVPTWLRVLIPTVLVLVWLAAFGAGGTSFGALSDVVENEQAQFLPDDAESTKVQDLQAGFRSADVIPAIIVYARDGGLTDADTAAISDHVVAFEDMAGVAAGGVSPPVPSEDGEAASVFVQVESSAEVDVTVEGLRERIAETGGDGLEAAVTGPAGFSTDHIGRAIWWPSKLWRASAPVARGGDAVLVATGSKARPAEEHLEPSHRA